MARHLAEVMSIKNELGRTIESGILFLVPELEPLVGSWRDKYDQSAREGFGAHVSLMVPFRPARLITDELVADLQCFFASQSLPQLEFGGICGFPDAIYLPAEPEDAVRDIIAGLAERYPDTSPYGGTIPLQKIIPHVTVAHSLDPRELLTISDAFCREAVASLPIRAEVREALLVVRDEAGTPRRRAALPFLV